MAYAAFVFRNLKDSLKDAPEGQWVTKRTIWRRPSPFAKEGITAKTACDKSLCANCHRPETGRPIRALREEANIGQAVLIRLDVAVGCVSQPIRDELHATDAGAATVIRREGLQAIGLRDGDADIRAGS